MIRKIVSLALSLLILGGLIALTEISEKNSGVETVLFLSPVSPRQAVKPVKKEYSDSEQAILDEYYEKMLKEYPSWRAIPREMLREHVVVGKNGSLSIVFTFCLGGMETDCMCRFFSNQLNPEGKWTRFENGFKRFYSTGFSQEQIERIRSALVRQIEEKIEEDDALRLREPVRDVICLFLYDDSGALTVSAEYIADRTPEIPGVSGCGMDHEHVFGRVELR